MIRLSGLVGQPIVSLKSAEQTGKVKGVIVVGNRIVGIETGSDPIDAAAVRSFDGDVLTFDPATTGSETIEGRDPLGARAVDVAGDELGTIKDLDIETDGTIVSLILADGRAIPGSLLRAIGSYAAIIATELPPPTVPGPPPS